MKVSPKELLAGALLLQVVTCSSAAVTHCSKAHLKITGGDAGEKCKDIVSEFDVLVDGKCHLSAAESKYNSYKAEWNGDNLHMHAYENEKCESGFFNNGLESKATLHGLKSDCDKMSWFNDEALQAICIDGTESEVKEGTATETVINTAKVTSAPVHIELKDCSTAILNGWTNECSGEPAISDLEVKTDGTCVNMKVANMDGSGSINLREDGEFEAKVWLGKDCGGADKNEPTAHAKNFAPKKCHTESVMFGMVTLGLEVQCGSGSRPTKTIASTPTASALPIPSVTPLVSLVPSASASPVQSVTPSVSVVPTASPSSAPSTSPSLSVVSSASYLSTPSASQTVSASTQPSVTPSTTSKPITAPSAKHHSEPVSETTTKHTTGQNKQCSTAILNGWTNKCSGDATIADLEVKTDGTCVNMKVAGMDGSGLINLREDGDFEAKVWLGKDCGGVDKNEATVHAKRFAPKKCHTESIMFGAMTLGLEVQCGNGSSPAKVAASTPVPSASPSPSVTPSVTFVPSATASPVQSVTPSVSVVPTASPSSVPSTSPSLSVAPSASSLPTPSASQTVSASTQPSVTPSATSVQITAPSAKHHSEPISETTTKHATGQNKQCSTAILNGWTNKCSGDATIADLEVKTDGTCVNMKVAGMDGSGSINLREDGDFEAKVWLGKDCGGADKNEPTAHAKKFAPKKCHTESVMFGMVTLGLEVQCGGETSHAKIVAPTPKASVSPLPSVTPSYSVVASPSSSPQPLPSQSVLSAIHASTTSMTSTTSSSTTSASTTTHLSESTESIPTTTTTTDASVTPITAFVASTRTPMEASSSSASQTASAVTTSPVMPSVVTTTATQVTATQSVASFVTNCAARFPGKTTSNEPCCRWGKGQCAGLSKCILHECIASETSHPTETSVETVTMQSSNNERVCGDMFHGSKIETNKPCCRHGDGVCPHLQKCTESYCTGSHHSTTTSAAKATVSIVASTMEITCAEKKVLDRGLLQCEVYESKPCCRHSGHCGTLAKCENKNCCRV